MTLVDLFNSFHDACRRINLTSDARSLFLAFMQHWNAQRRPQAVDISVQTLRETARLDDESYRRAAICLSNLKLWKMKRKAHAKNGRFIYIGEFFLGQNSDRRETVAEPAILASPPTPPSERELKPPSAVEVPPETKTETSHVSTQEKSPLGDFSEPKVTENMSDINWWVGKSWKEIYADKKALFFFQNAPGALYEAIFAQMRKNETDSRIGHQP